MINEICKEGMFDEALTLLSEMEDKDCIPDAITFETIVCALFENGENDKAAKLLVTLFCIWMTTMNYPDFFFNYFYRCPQKR